MDRQTAQVAACLVSRVDAAATDAVAALADGADPSAIDRPRRAHFQPARRQQCVARPWAADTAAFQSGYQRYRTQWLRARGQRGAETKS